MPVANLLVDAFSRVRDAVHEVVEGLEPDDLLLRVDRAANPIGWLVWHLARVEDDHIADAAGSEQVWTSQGYYERFGLPYPVEAHGYGQGSDEVGQFDVRSPDLLLSYYDAVNDQTRRYVAGLSDEDLERVVDTRWNPPVTLGVRLVSVISDGLQHAGQAAYVKGLARRD
ncbi:MAG: DUF664 domain-containing protein [Frankiaceae bacterium]|nr:DUF664 domain-containing protein [Frankiaceae bacterium]MBV9872459.1 DUF664 domain-containing protein [Frankiaceae bacterium]